MNRLKVEYQGYQFKDLLRDLLNEKGVLQIDLANMTKITPKTVSEWATGLSLPSQSHFQIVLYALAPTNDQEVRNEYIKHNTAIYTSIKEQFNIARLRIQNSK